MSSPSESDAQCHHLRGGSDGETHEVFNQPDPLEDFNAYSGDQALQDAVHREGGGDFEDRLEHYGAVVGGELLEVGFQANENPPKLKTYDRFGHRIDEVEFHPAYHRAMQLGVENGLTSLTWTEGTGSRVARSALIYMHYQTEAGTQCPLTMTHAAIPALRHQPEIAKTWEPLILSDTYDRRFIAPHKKEGLTIGMAMMVGTPRPSSPIICAQAPWYSTSEEALE